jgi:putative redox protein
VISDQPPANGGEDQGMTPPELLLSCLGIRAGFYAAQYLKAGNLPATGLSVTVHAESSRS